MLTREKHLKPIRGNGYHFVPKGGTFPTENHHACCEKLRFVRSIYPNLPQMGRNLYHGMLMPLHDSMPISMNFRRVLDLLEFKNKVSQRFAGNQQCPCVWNSFPFLPCDQSIPRRTHIWFFNQFICTRACACGSNLNYAHEMPRKPSQCIKMSKRTPKNSKSKHNTPVVLCWHYKNFESNKRQQISFRLIAFKIFVVST